MLARYEKDGITPVFLKARVRDAWAYRKAVIDTDSCRIIFGEADFLPGLTVDKFSDVLVVESLALGTERYKILILKALVDVLQEDGIKIRGIYERSDAKVRTLEGLERTKGFIGPEFDTNVPIVENGVKYIVDVKDGQKTGFFLDQKNNRAAVAEIVRRLNKPSVLDCFTHTGSFGLNCALAGAGAVLSVDASELAIRQAMDNARLNGLNPKELTMEEAAGSADAESPVCPVQAESSSAVRNNIQPAEGSDTCAACGICYLIFIHDRTLKSFKQPFIRHELRKQIIKLRLGILASFAPVRNVAYLTKHRGNIQKVCQRDYSARLRPCRNIADISEIAERRSTILN